MLKSCCILFVFCLIAAGCSDAQQPENEKPGDITNEHRPVVPGAARLIDAHLEELQGRNIGLVANPTARINETHLLDTLITLGVNIKALYAPEHGFRGDLPAGEEVKDGIDTETGLPVYSLYGRTRKPTAEMLSGIDVLLFDMQDVGVRFYTYISTLGYVLEAAAENNMEVWVLDRPNPLGGEYVSGFVLEPEFKSFVGMFPIPVAHGMTIGELARMMTDEGWLDTDKLPELRIIPMKNWDRRSIWPDTGLNWRAPSPNLPHFSNALLYPGTCFIEGTTMSEGRGTTDPFMMVGAPDLNLPNSALEHLMNRYPVLLERIEFTPESIPGVAVNPKHEGVKISGVRITPQILDPESLRPVEFGLELIREMLRWSPDSETNRFLYNLTGTRAVDTFFETSEHPAVYWIEAKEAFREQRAPYLMY